MDPCILYIVDPYTSKSAQYELVRTSRGDVNYIDSPSKSQRLPLLIIHADRSSCATSGPTASNGFEIFTQYSFHLALFYMLHPYSAQRVPEPDPLPGIFFDTRPDPIQF